MGQNLLDVSVCFCRASIRVEFTLALRPSLQMASQSLRDCSDAAALVSSILIHPVSHAPIKRLQSTDIVHTESIQCFGYPYFGLRIKEGICELFPFS